jgi:polysaccharide deacetylase 2 family uncharacterized protein YibQ
MYILIYTATYPNGKPRKQVYRIVNHMGSFISAVSKENLYKSLQHYQIYFPLLDTTSSPNKLYQSFEQFKETSLEQFLS